MKKCFVMAVSIFSLFSCSITADKIRTFIPGTYARFSDHEMRKEYDTINIEVVSAAGNNYRLLRSSTFQRKMDGQSFPWEHTNEEWTAIYDESKRVLNETRKGKVISFVPEKNILLVGTTEYKKIK
jgi:hypothetical protein